MGNDVSKRALTVDGSTIRIQRLLGEGGFAQVFLASLVDDGGRDVVLKRMRVSVDGEPRGREMHLVSGDSRSRACVDADGARLARREIEVLERLPPHPNIVSFVAASEREMHGAAGSERYFEFALVIEFCSGGSLFDEAAGFLRRKEPYPEARLLRRFRDAALAIAHLHSQDPPICHRDIKPGSQAQLGAL